MTDAYLVLLTSAASLGFIHTAIGIDHSLPFVLLARSSNWSLRRTLSITGLCGLGHVMSSVLIASVGLGLGIAGSRLEWLEEKRGSLAATLLIAFGVVYALLAVWRSRQHSHKRSHHDHGHGALSDELPLVPSQMLPRVLFVIFVLGPCEALIPLLTASGLTLSLTQASIVTLCFSLATLVTMVGLVAFGYLGASVLPLRHVFARLHGSTHAVAGITIAMSGISIKLLGI